jgi:flagellar hook-associated protein 3 FlgL
VGARINRLEMTQQRLEDLSINLQQLQSKTEDADIAEVVMQLKMSENVYQASLAVGARIIRSSLIDFMR